ncbi:MAG: hypothetical protein WC556_13365 [Candidatus Methanoperedens sp.]
MVKHSKNSKIKNLTKKEETLSVWRKYYNIILKNKTKIIEVMGVISFIFGIFGIITYFESSNQITTLENRLNETYRELNATHEELIKAKNEINNLSIANKDEILLALYEVKSIGFDNQSRENFFQKKFGFSYEIAQNILNYLSKTDDSDLGFQSLMRNDYNSSLYHFEMALIKDPTSNESKIGKSIALIGLKRSNESRKILFELEPTYPNKIFIYYLIGYSYYNEGNYSKSVDYYMLSLGYISTKSGPNSGLNDINNLELISFTCEIKATGLFDSPWISINNESDGSKHCKVILKDFGVVVEQKYKLSQDIYSTDYTFVRKYAYPEPTGQLGAVQTPQPVENR